MDSQVTFGILLAVTIVLGLIANFLILPVLVMTFQSFGPESGKVQTGAPSEPGT